MGRLRVIANAPVVVLLKHGDYTKLYLALERVEAQSGPDAGVHPIVVSGAWISGGFR